MNMETIVKLLKAKTSKQIQKQFCGKLIGNGSFRKVYEMIGHPDYVIKIEKYPDHKYFTNITEWHHWQNNKDWKFLRNWLAPCLFISSDGKLLVQRRAELKEKREYPKRIPVMFTDTKIQNFGFIDNKCVCFDYSFLVLHTGKTMLKRAIWKSNNGNSMPFYAYAQPT